MTARDLLRGADRLEQVVESTLAEIARLTHAPYVLLLTGEGVAPAGEFWFPQLDQIPEAQRSAIRKQAGSEMSASESVAPALGTMPPATLFRLEAAGRVRGMLAWTSPAGQARTPVEGALAPWLDLLALRLAHEEEIVHGLHTRSQYERWFRTLDEQLRVLDRERQKFAAIVHRFDASVFVTDTARRIRWTNSVMGATPPPGPEGSSWVGQGCQSACSGYGASDGSEECSHCPVREALELNQVTHREYRHGEAGDERSHYLSALPIKGPDGRAYEVMVMIQDLSDLEILRKSESRYRLLFERSAKAILMIDPVSRRILLANPMACHMTGYTRETLVRLRLEDLHHPDEWLRLQPAYARAFGEGALGAQPCRVMSSDGAYREAVLSGTRYDMGGQEVVMIDFEDVTENVRVREALMRAEARLQTVVANSPLVLFSIDRNGVFTLSEGRGLDSLGLEPGQVVGQSVYEVYRDHPAVLLSIQRALTGKAFTETIPVGSSVFETHYMPTFDEDQRVSGLIGVATDVTERRTLEAQLRHAQRMEAIGRLAGGVAHDFNNLLAAILGHGELMMNELPEAHPLRRNAEEIQKAGVRGALLTRQLLAFSRKEVLSPSVVDINAIMLALEELLHRLIGEDIDLIMIPAMVPVRSRGDRSQFEQIIMNLALNARDAMPQGGRLSIEIGLVDLDESYARQHARVRPGRYAVIAVSDSGVGMDSETLAHAFEPFYTTKEQGKGTGLGLSTVYGIAEQSGGHVWVYSEPGIGTTFKVYLPETSAEIEESQEPVGVPQPARGVETILLVEDEDTVRSLGREVLAGRGYRVLEGSDGVDAMRVAAAFQGPIDLLVTDVVMPRMGGGELAEKLTALRPSMRVLYVSGYTDDSVIRHGVRERGAAFLQKPFSLDAFSRKVREVLDAPPGESMNRKAS